MTEYVGTDEIVVSVSAPANEPPTALLSADVTSGLAPLTVEFDSSGSTDGDGTIVSRVLDFGDGSPTSTDTVVSHTYAAGTYTATLTITDDDGATDQATRSITALSSGGGDCPERPGWVGPATTDYPPGVPSDGAIPVTGDPGDALWAAPGWVEPTVGSVEGTPTFNAFWPIVVPEGCAAGLELSFGWETTGTTAAAAGAWIVFTNPGVEIVASGELDSSADTSGTAVSGLIELGPGTHFFAISATNEEVGWSFYDLEIDVTSCCEQEPPTDLNCQTTLTISGVYEARGFDADPSAPELLGVYSQWYPTFDLLDGAAAGQAFLLGYGQVASGADPSLIAYDVTLSEPLFIGAIGEAEGPAFGTPIEGAASREEAYPVAEIYGYEFVAPQCGVYRAYLYFRRLEWEAPIELWISSDGETWTEVPI